MRLVAIAVRPLGEHRDIEWRLVLVHLAVAVQRIAAVTRVAPVLMPMPSPCLASCLEHAKIRLSKTEPLSELPRRAGACDRVACHEAAQLEHVDGSLDHRRPARAPHGVADVDAGFTSLTGKRRIENDGA